MIHIRIDDFPDHARRQFACGIGPELPPGDLYLFESESHRFGALFAVHPEAEPCPGCFPGGRPEFGTPLSKISGRPGHPGYAEFCRIAESWGMP